ncbi:hypothetical protein BsWGS_19572 [Bradybaena similaris]
MTAVLQPHRRVTGPFQSIALSTAHPLSTSSQSLCLMHCHAQDIFNGLCLPLHCCNALLPGNTASIIVLSDPHCYLACPKCFSFQLITQFMSQFSSVFKSCSMSVFFTFLVHRNTQTSIHIEKYRNTYMENNL